MPSPTFITNFVNGAALSTTTLVAHSSWVIRAINIHIEDFQVQTNANGSFQLYDGSTLIIRADVSQSAAATDAGAVREIMNLSDLHYASKGGNLILKAIPGATIPTALWFNYTILYDDWSI